MLHGYLISKGSHYYCDQCDYTPKEKVTIETHIIYVREDQTQEIDTTKLMKVQNVFVTDVNIQQKWKLTIQNHIKSMQEDIKF